MQLQLVARDLGITLKAWVSKLRLFYQYNWTTNGKPTMKVIAIRRENYGTLWERRAPLNPRQVKGLVSSGIKVIVQPSTRRAYPNQNYEKAGAVVQDDMTEASLIVGIKQVPIADLIPNKTYSFFAHVIKAQPDNMTMLDAILEKNVRLMDWEMMSDYNGVRMDSVFGRFAGLSGMLDILHGMGLRLLGLGYNTPFINIAAPHSYPSLVSACAAVKYAGEQITGGFVPESLGPITFVFLGAGSVSQGAQYVLSHLPVEFIQPSELKAAAQKGDRCKVYATVLRRQHHMVRKSGEAGFSREEYDAHPERYRSIFAEEFAPWTSCLINAVLWTYDQPRTLSLADTKRLYGSHTQNVTNGNANPLSEGSDTSGLKHRLVAISDITADPGGSIELVTGCTSIEKPFELYNVDTGELSSMTFSGDGILLCSVSNMPSQLPMEATDAFGELLAPLIPELASSDASTPLSDEQFKSCLQKSVIASNGQLTSTYQYIHQLRADNKV